MNYWMVAAGAAGACLGRKKIGQESRSTAEGCDFRKGRQECRPNERREARRCGSCRGSGAIGDEVMLTLTVDPAKTDFDQTPVSATATIV